MTTVDRAYAELLGEELPRAIHTEREYRRCLARAEALLEMNRSKAEDRFLELLAVLIERYEFEKDPILPAAPVDALKELMAANGMSQANLAALLGSSGIASEVLAGKRSLSKAHAKKLAAAFNVSVALFV